MSKPKINSIVLQCSCAGKSNPQIIAVEHDTKLPASNSCHEFKRISATKISYNSISRQTLAKVTFKQFGQTINDKISNHGLSSG